MCLREQKCEYMLSVSVSQNMAMSKKSMADSMDRCKYE